MTGDQKKQQDLVEASELAEEKARQQAEASSGLAEARSQVQSLPQDSELSTLRHVRERYLQAILSAESLDMDVSLDHADLARLDKAIKKAEGKAKKFGIVDASSPHTNLADSYDVFGAGQPMSAAKETGEAAPAEKAVGKSEDELPAEGQAKTYLIDDIKVLREFSDPTRKEIVQCLYYTARSARETAELIGFPRTKIYYHLKKLLKVKLIFVAETEVIHGITKKKYLNVARSFEIAPSLYKSQLFVETGFPTVQTPESLLEEETAAESAALSPMDEAEELKKTEAHVPEEEEFMYEAPADIEESADEDLQEHEEEAVEEEAAPVIQATQVDTSVEKVEVSSEMDAVVDNVQEQNIDATVSSAEPRTEPVAEEDANPLLASLLKSRTSQPAMSAGQKTGEAAEDAAGFSPVAEEAALTKSVIVDDKEFHIPESDLTPDGIDFAVRNARKSHGEMMSIEEKTLLRNHLLSLKLDEGSEDLDEELEISEHKVPFSVEQRAETPLNTFFKERALNIYRRLKGYSKAVTFVKSRNKVTFLMTEVKGDGFVIRKARAYELPYETEDVLIEELTELIHYVYHQEVKKKRWNRYYLGFYSSDFPIEADLVKVPQMSKKELSGFLANQIADRFSIQKNDMVMDWLSYGAKSKEDLEISSFCLFTDRESISRGYDYLVQRGIQPRYLTSILKLQYNIYRNQYKASSSGNAVLIYFGHKRSRITLVNDWEIVKSRGLFIGLENFVQAYRDASSSIEEAQEMTHNDIYSVLFQSGLPAVKEDTEEVPADDTEENTSSGNYEKIINSVTSKFLSEIYATLRNFETKGMRKSSEFYASGPGTAIPNIVEIISRSVGKDVKLLEMPLETMIHKDFEGELAPENRQNFMLNLGLILDPSEELSLMPEGHKDNFQWFLPNRLIQITMAIVFTFSAIFTTLGYSSMKELQAHIPPKKAELKLAMDDQSKYFKYFKELRAINGFSVIQERDRMEGRKIIRLLQLLTNSASNRITMNSIASDAIDGPLDNDEGNILTLSGEISPPSVDTKIILKNLLHLLRNAEHVTDTQLVESFDLSEGLLSFSIRVTL